MLLQLYSCHITSIIASPFSSPPTIIILAVALDVTISSSPTGTRFPAASSLSLTCQASLGTGDYTYSWSSDCSGQCFARGATTAIVSTAVLHSRDSGLHTCSITDSHGNTGRSSVSVTVIGEMFVKSLNGLEITVHVWDPCSRAFRK